MYVIEEQGTFLENYKKHTSYKITSINDSNGWKA